MDEAEALFRIQEAANADPPKISLIVGHARLRQAGRNVTTSNIHHCLRTAGGCHRSEDAPDRWVVKGVDLARNELTVVIDVIKVLGKGFRCEVVTVY